MIFAAPLDSILLFAIGTALIGFGAGLFGHCTLTAAMGTARTGQIGLALGVWGAVQASAAGSAVAAGGLIRDGISFAGLERDSRASDERAGDRVFIRLPYRDLLAVRYADCHRSASPAADVDHAGTAPGFSLGELPSHSLSLPR